VVTLNTGAAFSNAARKELCMTDKNRMTIDKDLTTNMCFCCGEDNPIGLHLAIKSSEGTASAVWTVSENYVGWNNTLHGGILAAIADEVMGHVVDLKREKVVTAHMEVDFIVPIRLGDTLRCEASISSTGRRSVKTEAVIRVNGQIAAKSSGVYVKIA
jgi:uncharacterized protein (TIGR00369 family)